MHYELPIHRPILAIWEGEMQPMIRERREGV
jgi:hypothetical protein